MTVTAAAVTAAVAVAAAAAGGWFYRHDQVFGCKNPGWLPAGKMK